MSPRCPQTTGLRLFLWCAAFLFCFVRKIFKGYQWCSEITQSQCCLVPGFCCHSPAGHKRLYSTAALVDAQTSIPCFPYCPRHNNRKRRKLPIVQLNKEISPCHPCYLLCYWAVCLCDAFGGVWTPGHCVGGQHYSCWKVTYLWVCLTGSSAISVAWGCCPSEIWNRADLELHIILLSGDTVSAYQSRIF